MQFESLAAFIAMDGQGFYIWLSYGFFLVCFMGLVLAALRERRLMVAQLARQMRRDALSRKPTAAHTETSQEIL